MPNIITHTLFADEFLEDASTSLQEWLLPRKQLVEIGANGPDFLFFHGLSPTRAFQKTSLRKLGSKVHSQHIREFYQCALACIRKEKDREIQKDMTAYLMGHLMHWSLDSTAHPYVYYRTGCKSAQSSWWHHRFESLIDAIMLKVKREQTIQDFKAYTITDASLEQVRAIARIYVPVARQIYGVDVKPHQILESIEDWNFMQKVFYDASGKKFHFFYNIEKMTNTESAVSGFFVPNQPEDPFDTINLLHKEWVHPCDDEIKSTESFFDLYDRAMDKAFKVNALLLECLEDSTRDEDFLSFIGQKDYDTGLEENLPMVHFDLVYNSK